MSARVRTQQKKTRKREDMRKREKKNICKENDLS